MHCPASMNSTLQAHLTMWNQREVDEELWGDWKARLEPGPFLWAGMGSRGG